MFGVWGDTRKIFLKALQKSCTIFQVFSGEYFKIHETNSFSRAITYSKHIHYYKELLAWASCEISSSKSDSDRNYPNFASGELKRLFNSAGLRPRPLKRA